MSVVQSSTTVAAETELPGLRAWRKVWLGPMAVVGHITRIARSNVEMAALLWKHGPWTSLARVLVMVLMVATPFLMNWSSGQIIADVSRRKITDAGELAMWGLAVALVISGALPLIMSVLDRLIDNWAFKHVQQAQVTKVPDLDPITYSDPRLKDKIQQVQQRAVWRIMGFAKSQILLFRALALIVISALVLARFEPWICIMIVALMSPSMLLEGVHAHRQFKVEEDHSEYWRRFWEEKGQILGSKTLSYLQVFGAAHWFAKRFADRLEEALGEYDVIERKSVIYRTLAMALGMAALVFAALLLIGAVTNGKMDVARFVIMLGALSQLGMNLAEIASVLGQQMGQSLYLSSFQDVMELESRTHFPDVGEQPSIGEKGADLELRHVRFGYPQGAGKTMREVIKGISLKVPAGQKWAFVGINGAGKSTLKALLVRLFDPDYGEVLIGGVPVKLLDRASMRSLVSCLPQEIQHFNLTVREFIALGKAGQEIDDERVRWAAKRSGAAEFVEQYPNQYAQSLGRDYKNSEEPSGGQLQKLALASLLYMGAPLMVLDEPTAAIDPEAARDFWNTLFNECPGQTVVFSTHYLGAVRRADCIVVLAQGAILDCGTHSQLMGRCETYRKLFQSQACDFQD